MEKLMKACTIARLSGFFLDIWINNYDFLYPHRLKNMYQKETNEKSQVNDM